ncbi:helix-turn-helix transcriptional regulator [Nocardia crassostreae]|uniref:helix-turn-helix transcriptional regulator n=1 Tax=Nocardia crassostreae TaxID=53428 RepID=UPI0012FBA3A5|nr:LuxR C-terminal-related transcriptional regulator [Nocardia crassostreae]
MRSRRPEEEGEILAGLLTGGDARRLRIARAVAVLGPAATASLVATLLDADLGEIEKVVGELAEAGVLAGERCAHPAIAARLLANLSEPEARDLHGRAAELLHRNEFPAALVARHLVAAGDARGSWAARVLLTAADEAAGVDELDRTEQCLELAYRASRRADDRAGIAVRLVTVEWRINASDRTRNFGRLKAALRTGRVPGAELPATVLHMLWHGYTLHADHALNLIDRGRGEAGPADARLDFLCAWLRYSHPTQVPGHPRLLTGRPRVRGYDPAEENSPYRQASELLIALWTQQPPAEIAAAAQRILAGHRLTLDTVEVLVAAVDCLIHSDRLDTADAWCAALLAEAAARSAPTWQSVFAAARAETLLRKGDLTGAAEYATLALNLVPAEHLGVWVGRPIAVLVRACTAQGKHAEAAAQLRRPVPRALFESRFALPYLSAYGEHCLATGRAEDALRHIRRCGNLMHEWNLDFAWLVPWRNELAAAWLALGQQWQAQTFVTAHLDLIGGAEAHHSGGTALRLLAATSDAHRRVVLLRRAVALLRAGADEVELATALTDLSEAYRAIGDVDRARPLLREAARLAEGAGAQVLRGRLRGVRPLPEPATAPVAATARLEALSPAERRVAELAAHGRRNREIAAELDITTSTVEQHLTRVYRKLSVARRSELRFALVAGEGAGDTRTAVG